MRESKRGKHKTALVNLDEALLEVCDTAKSMTYMVNGMAL